MTHQVAVASYESYVQAWVLDLPGCIAGAADTGTLASRLPLVIAEHAAWLRAHGQRAEAGPWEVVETIDVAAASLAGGEFCFEAERAPLGAKELETGIAHMTYARDDLLAAVRPLPDAVLDWRPPASLIRHVDAWAPEPRTIRETMEHALRLEAYYRDGLRDDDAAGIFEAVGGAAEERARTIALLRALTGDQRSRVYRPRRPGREERDAWTVRKLLRRVISHDRAHTFEVRQLHAWAVQGTE